MGIFFKHTNFLLQTFSLDSFENGSNLHVYPPSAQSAYEVFNCWFGIGVNINFHPTNLK